MPKSFVLIVGQAGTFFPQSIYKHLLPFTIKLFIPIKITQTRACQPSSSTCGHVTDRIISATFSFLLTWTWSTMGSVLTITLSILSLEKQTRVYQIHVHFTYLLCHTPGPGPGSSNARPLTPRLRSVFEGENDMDVDFKFLPSNLMTSTSRH